MLNAREKEQHMVKVITYGTYDLLHHGHIRLLERAKALGDYLVVGVTADDFDKIRGKINVRESLMERIEAVRATGIADEIIVEEYEGQKIDDIKRYDVDIFTVGSDWIGKFDYLGEYCKVIYLDRTEGVSSSDIRAKNNAVRLGFVGESKVLEKYVDESRYVNGIDPIAACSHDEEVLSVLTKRCSFITSSYDDLLEHVDAVYIVSQPSMHYERVKRALAQGKHVLCESPISLDRREADELFRLAKKSGLILMDAIKTAYSTAYYRLLLLAKSGRIGSIVSVDATCTSLADAASMGTGRIEHAWNSMCAWGPTAMLPIFQLLGVDYSEKQAVSLFADESLHFDAFTKMDFVYPRATASFKVGKGVKSEGELIVSGTNGYLYVPAPWWKTEYFELRFENPANNKRYFYQLDGEGIRYELASFARSIESIQGGSYISEGVSKAIVRVIEDFYLKKDLRTIVI